MSFARKCRRRRARVEQPVRTLELEEPIHVGGKEIRRLEFYSARGHDSEEHAEKQGEAESVDFEDGREATESLVKQYGKDLKVLMKGE